MLWASLDPGTLWIDMRPLHLWSLTASLLGPELLVEHLTRLEYFRLHPFYLCSQACAVTLWVKIHCYVLSVISISIEYCVFLFLNLDARTLLFQNRYTDVFVVFVKKCGLKSLWKNVWSMVHFYGSSLMCRQT